MARSPYRFEYHPQAIVEAHDALQWYSEQSVAASQKFEAELLIAEDQIARHPEAWAEYLHGTRRYLLASFPYAVVYSIHHDTICGIAVAHLHRRPGYWHDRLSP